VKPKLGNVAAVVKTCGQIVADCLFLCNDSLSFDLIANHDFPQPDVFIDGEVSERDLIKFLVATAKHAIVMCESRLEREGQS
jgi:hypothetical protein